MEVKEFDPQQPMIAVDYSRRSWIFLALAICLSSCNQMQRFSNLHLVIGFVVSGSDLLHDTNTSSIEYGLLSGAAFLLVYALFTMPVVRKTQSRLVDHIQRPKWFLLANLALFNVATGLTALAENFWGLVWPRALFALFSTAIDPTILRLLAFYFPPEKRGAASGLYFLAIYVGSALSALSLIISKEIGWRLCFVFVAGVSLVICCIFGLLLDDVRMKVYMNPETVRIKGKLKEDLKELCKNKTLVLTMAALFCRYLAGFGRGFFEAPYFSSAFPNDQVAFTVIYFCFLLMAPASLYIGGWYSDSKEATKPHIRPMVCAITCLAATPFLLLMYLSNIFWLSMLGLFFVYGYGETYLSVSFAMLINVTTPHIRALRKDYR